MEKLHSLLALSHVVIISYISSPQLPLLTIMFSAMGGLQKTRLYCQLFEKADSAQGLPLTLNTKENLPSFKSKRVKTVACFKNSLSWALVC